MDLDRLKLVLKTLADDTRLRIVSLLLDNREISVKEICGALGINQPSVSKHLGKLRLVRIVNDKRIGNSVFYSLNTESDHRIIQIIISNFSNLVEIFKEDKERLSKLV